MTEKGVTIERSPSGLGMGMFSPHLGGGGSWDQQQNAIITKITPSNAPAARINTDNQEKEKRRKKSGEKSNVGRSCGCGGWIRAGQLEHDLAELKTTHNALLAGLHVQIESLKQKNRDLTFQLLMGPYAGGVKTDVPLSPESDEAISPKNDVPSKPVDSNKAKKETISSTSLQSSTSPVTSSLTKNAAVIVEKEEPKLEKVSEENLTNGDATVVRRKLRGRSGRGDPRLVRSLDLEILEEEAHHTRILLEEERAKNKYLTTLVDDLKSGLKEEEEDMEEEQEEECEEEVMSGEDQELEEEKGEALGTPYERTESSSQTVEEDHDVHCDPSSPSPPSLPPPSHPPPPPPPLTPRRRRSSGPPAPLPLKSPSTVLLGQNAAGVPASTTAARRSPKRRATLHESPGKIQREAMQVLETASDNSTNTTSTLSTTTITTTTTTTTTTAPPLSNNVRVVAPPHLPPPRPPPRQPPRTVPLPPSSPRGPKNSSSPHARHINRLAGAASPPRGQHQLDDPANAARPQLQTDRQAPRFPPLRQQYQPRPPAAQGASPARRVVMNGDRSSERDGWGTTTTTTLPSITAAPRYQVEQPQPQQQQQQQQSQQQQQQQHRGRGRQYGRGRTRQRQHQQQHERQDTKGAVNGELPVHQTQSRGGEGQRPPSLTRGTGGARNQYHSQRDDSRGRSEAMAQPGPSGRDSSQGNRGGRHGRDGSVGDGGGSSTSNNHPSTATSSSALADQKRGLQNAAQEQEGRPENRQKRNGRGHRRAGRGRPRKDKHNVSAEVSEGGGGGEHHHHQ
ncbi:uncharacterized protein [Palaemon carinicauda]|uniref:uncharacterized protein isoform X1 n=1 Tax=Palaemon carinicauda TaxID=392227 RepID=UPI0035B5B2B5